MTRSGRVSRIVIIFEQLTVYENLALALKAQTVRTRVRVKKQKTRQQRVF
jgi:ABC-type uncharacterized transport system ATPase subunit